MTGYIKCPKCYKSIREGTPFCPHCGEKQVDKRAKDEFGKDPYFVLQVSHHAEPEVIEAAYKRLAKKYHPDYNKSTEAQERIKELNWAYEILGNKERREEYDKVKGEKTRQQSGEYKPRHKEKPRPSPPPKKSKPTPTTKYNKQDKPTNRGWLYAGILIPIGLCLFVFFIGSINKSTGSIANSEKVVISDNTKSPTKSTTKKATKIPTTKATRIPTNTPRLGLDYFTLNITEGGSNEIVETYKAIEYQLVERHIGERLAVCGTVTSVYQAGLLGITYIEFGSKFAAIILQSNRSEFEDILEYLEGEDICVYGLISKETNKVHLELTDILHIFGDFWEKGEATPSLIWPPETDGTRSLTECLEHGVVSYAVTSDGSNFVWIKFINDKGQWQETKSRLPWCISYDTWPGGRMYLYATTNFRPWYIPPGGIEDKASFNCDIYYHGENVANDNSVWAIGTTTCIYKNNQ